MMKESALPAGASPKAAHPTAGAEAGVTNPGAVACLEPFLYRDMRWCVNCAGEEVFVEVFECDAGRVGVCLGCGDERLIPWSRANSEAA